MQGFAASDEPTVPGGSSRALGTNMQYLLIFTLFLCSIACVNGQDTSIRFIIDEPVPAYREFWQGIRIMPPPDIPPFVINPHFSVNQESMIGTDLHETTHGEAQIRLIFKSSMHAEIQQFLEDNRERKVSIELGDYILPIDFAKTLPWKGSVWTQPRKSTKSKVILDSFRKRNKSS